VYHAHAHAHGATVNDVVVTAVTGALVELLARRGERVAELVVSVPVSRRRSSAPGAFGNETGVVPIRVPAVPDPAVRRAAVVAQRARVAAPERGGSAAVLTPAFRALAAVRAFQPFIDHQRLVHTFVTIVRGPAHHLRVAGAEVAAVVPVAVNPGNVAVSFDVLSYAGTLVVTLVCDRGWCPSRRGCPTG
jgi:diacylglycerol O-acyltransferase / wax synthase